MTAENIVELIKAQKDEVADLIDEMIEQKENLDNLQLTIYVLSQSTHSIKQISELAHTQVSSMHTMMQ